VNNPIEVIREEQDRIENYLNDTTDPNCEVFMLDYTLQEVVQFASVLFEL